MKNIVRVLAMIPEGSLEKKRIIALETMMRKTYQTHFGNRYVLVFVWMSIPTGQAFQAGKPSTAFTVQIPVDDGLPDAPRHAFMREVCSRWMHITGCDKTAIILNSPDRSDAKKQFDTFNDKFNASQRTATQLTLATRLLYGRLRKGYFTTSINL